MPTSKPADRRPRAAPDAPILITMGEPGGVGPELAVGAWRTLNGRAGARPLRLVGDPDVFQSCADVAGEALIPTRRLSKPRQPGLTAPENVLAVTDAIETSVDLAMKGAAAAAVTAPIHKAAMIAGGFAFPGHTEFLAHLTGAERAVMMLAGADLRVVPLTIHEPLARVPGLVTTRAIVETGEIVLSALKRDFGVAAPRLAVAGLNPHAGEQGEIGREEIEIIAPAVEALRGGGHDVVGPLPADTMFHAEARARYDAALCMYHDQALIPIKTLAFWEGVNVTLGLPIVRTSPDHGTALDLAGTGKADLRSMLAAIELAAKMADARNR
ncbi:MAG: 4-hydroxythreonine-4-phosphate dehydrogenase PdxA [Alphaproteobacteria bacterium]|nr:4-hydroxythreonine-4-phosphate dehydrogenase PdxA [Alphaproteobacteria bacterium]